MAFSENALSTRFICQIRCYPHHYSNINTTVEASQNLGVKLISECFISICQVAEVSENVP